MPNIFLLFQFDKGACFYRKPKKKKKNERGSGWGTRVHPWQMHVDVWQNQYNIVKWKK